MMKWMLAAGAAALAIASPVSADRGGHGGKGQGGQQAQSDRGGGGGGQKQAKSNRGGGDRQVRMISAITAMRWSRQDPALSFSAARTARARPTCWRRCRC